MSKNIIICDIDGTIANLQHRLHFIKNPDGTKKKKPDWDSFHKACVDDTPYDDVIEILCSLVEPVGNWAGREVYFFSGRNASVRRETIEWLEKHVPITKVRWARPYSDEVRNDPDYDPRFPYDRGEWFNHLLMRSEGDRRPDKIIKLEMAERAGLTPDNVLCILDDRQSVVDMWRENGFRVMQVDAWKE